MPWCLGVLVFWYPGVLVSWCPAVVLVGWGSSLLIFALGKFTKYTEKKEEGKHDRSHGSSMVSDVVRVPSITSAIYRQT